MTAPRAAQRGFALPFTIFLVALLSLMLTASFTRVAADRRRADTSGASVSALAVAQSALQRYLGDTATGAVNPSTICPAGRPRLRPPDGDSVRINVQGGFADVVARVVETPADSLLPRMYIVRSTGRVLEPPQGPDPQAVRTVAQFALWQRGAINTLAAFTAAAGLTRAGTGTLYISGADGTGTAPNVYGARVPAGNPALGATIVGSPGGVLAQDAALTVATLTRINWASVVNGGLVPDFIGVKWADYNYITHVVYGNYTTPVATNIGTGLMVVTGDLTIKGAQMGWHGIILVGGTLRDSTTNNVGVFGALVTGLNVRLGVTPAPSVVGTGPRFEVFYNTCTVRTSLLPLTGFVPVRNAWVDNWATY